MAHCVSRWMLNARQWSEHGADWPIGRRAIIRLLLLHALQSTVDIELEHVRRRVLQGRISLCDRLAVLSLGVT